jgi:hypothetical protein
MREAIKMRCTIAADNAVRGAFAHLLPDPDMEPEALDLWRLADRFACADARHVMENRRMLCEAYRKLGNALEVQDV